MKPWCKVGSRTNVRSNTSPNSDDLKTSRLKLYILMNTTGWFMRNHIFPNKCIFFFILKFSDLDSQQQEIHFNASTSITDNICRLFRGYTRLPTEYPILSIEYPRLPSVLQWWEGFPVSEWNVTVEIKFARP